MMTVPSFPSNAPPHELACQGGRLVSTTGRALPLLGSVLSADAAGGIARVTLEQRFKNPHAEPLAVTYSLPLPHDGAVSGFAFRVGERRVVGEIDRRRAARERYEQALVEGRSAALLEQDRASLFTQEIGNIPPGEEVTVEVSIDQRLRWLDEGAWEWRFPTVVAPRYLGEPGRVPDADRVAQDVADGALGARVALSCTIRDALADGRKPESPSHAVETLTAGGALRVELRDKAGARLDRDVVVRWRVTTPKVGIALDTGRAERGAASQHAHGLLTIVPPSLDAGRRAVARDLILLLDTSGSMGGDPLAHAVRVASALVSTLREQDRLEMIEFSSASRRWKSSPVAANEPARREALSWLAGLQASGGTEMRTGILEALATVRKDAQRQVVLITDGQIGFESQVVAAICDRLPVSSRLHTVGVGSAVNRSLTGPAARAGHGIEVIMGLGEDAERAASRIVARTNAPLFVDLQLGGDALVEHAPVKLPDLFAGAPALVGVALKPEGGELTVRGRTPDGSWEQRIRVPAIAQGEGNRAVVALFGREAVEDLETRLGAGDDAHEIDASIERIGVDFQISTRLTSWVAVSQDRTVDPSEPLRRERMPHELPHGMSAEGLGLRPATAAAPAMPSIVDGAIRRRLASPAAPMQARVAALPRGISPRIEVGEEVRMLDGPFANFTGTVVKMDNQKLQVKVSIFGRPTSVELDFASVEKRGGRDDEATTRDLLRGRIALRRGRQLIVEVFADGADLAWAPNGPASVMFADGDVVIATIATRGTTRKGTVAAGAVARLTLELPEGAPETEAVQSIAIELDGVTVIIEV
jgi:Ca-activated chloride channel family protein